MELSLKCVYNVAGTPYYSIIRYDEHLLNISQHIYNLQELKDELSVSGDARHDFSIEDGMLRCNMMTQTYNIDNATLLSFKDEMKHNVSFLRSGSLYSVLALCVAHDAIILDPQFSDKWSEGLGLAKAADIQFGEDDMSCFVRMLNNNGYYKYQIVKCDENGKAHFNELQFAMNELSEPIDNVIITSKAVRLGSENIPVYSSDVLGIYDDIILSGGLINQASCDSVVNKCAIKMCNKYLERTLISNALNTQEQGPSAVASPGVYVRSSCTLLSDLIFDKIYDIVMAEVNSNATQTDEQIISTVLEKCKTKDVDIRALTYSTNTLLRILKVKQSVFAQIQAAFTMRHELNKQRFWNDMYVYRVRNLHNLSGITYSDTMKFYGGNTTEFTEIIEVK